MRKASIALLTAVVLVCSLYFGAGFVNKVQPVHAQQLNDAPIPVAGVYDATQYKYGASIISGNSATGAQTITVCPASFTNGGNGYSFFPFAPSNGTFAPIIVDQGSSVSETVTPTAYSLISSGTVTSGFSSCANITATFAQVHGASLNPNQVASGDQGIQEAVNDASSKGGGLVYFQADTGNLTLATGAATTTSTAFVPTAFFSEGASCRVLTTITTAANYSLGISGATTAFVNASTQLTATNVQTMAFLNAAGAKTGTTIGTGTTALLVTTNVNPGAGALHCKAWGYVPVQANQ